MYRVCKDISDSIKMRTHITIYFPQDDKISVKKKSAPSKSDGPVPFSRSDVLKIPSIPCPLQSTSLNELEQIFDPLRSENFGMDIYVDTVSYVMQKVLKQQDNVS